MTSKAGSANTAILIALAAGVLGCGQSGSGELRVVVKDVSMAPVAAATITTEPGTKSAVTDTQGSVVLDGVPARMYVVNAVHPAIGMASTQVSVESGKRKDLMLILRRTATTDAGVSGTPDAGQPSEAGDATVSNEPSIVLQPLTKDSNGVNLRWLSTGTFVAYRVYRSQDPMGALSVIDVINDVATRSYRDATAGLGAVYRYRLGGIGLSGGETVSNTEMITTGVSIAVNSQVERMKCDPKRPYLYALDKVNNSLHFINTNENTVEKTIFVGSAPTDLDINLEGTELFIANSGATEIAVVDLTTRTKSRSLLVDVGTSAGRGNPMRLVCTAGNTLVFGGYDGYFLRLVSGSNGATIASVSNSFNTPSLVASPDGTRVYATNYNLVRFDIVGAMMKQADTDGGSSGSSMLSLVGSRDGTYLFYGAKKILSTNLKSQLGTFPEVILAASTDGSVAVGATRIYDATTFAAKATLPLSTPVMALSSDDKTLYLYQQASSRIFTFRMP